MQPPPHPSTWITTWLQERNLVPPGGFAPYLRQLHEAEQKLDFSSPPPTLWDFLERDGHLTHEQRVEGQAEAARQEASFMSWRSETLQAEARMREALPPPPPS